MIIKLILFSSETSDIYFCSNKNLFNFGYANDIMPLNEYPITLQ